MTTTYHTAITVGAAANAATFNAPLATLDAQLVANQAAIDALTLATGNAATLANGAASAAQKVIVVDSTSGFLAGAPIAYTLVGGAIEFNTIATVDSSTQLTTTTNLGTGGIANDTYIAVLPPGAMSSTGDVDGATNTKQTFTTGAFIGGLASSGDDNGIAVGRASTNPLADGGSHAFRDESTYVSSGATGGYASYDAVATMGGTLNPNGHLYAFQARNIFTPSGAGTLSTCAGVVTLPTINGPTTDVYGMLAVDPLGAGTIAMNVALYVGQLSRGTANYTIYSQGTQPSYHAGVWQTGSNIIAGGAVSGTNFYTNNDYNQACFGIGTPNTSKIGYYLVAVGHNAGTAITSGEAIFDTFVGSSAGAAVTTGDTNTFVGAYAGFSMTTGSGCTFLGQKAGYSETNSNRLYIANGDTASPLIYGVFDNATAANQEIKFNCGKMGFFGHATAAQPTKAGNNNWAALADVVNALVAIGIFDTA